MTSPEICVSGAVTQTGCTGHISLCINPGFVWDFAIKLKTKLGADADWPAGTETRIRFSWGTGTELIIPGTVDGPYLRFHMLPSETEQLPRGTWATVDVNFDSGDPDLWRPKWEGRVNGC